MIIRSAKDLIVYQKAFELAMEIFHASKRFPADERYSLISQIRRSSRSVSLNLQEAWAKRRYKAHFISKLTDCDGEVNETETSLDFALRCKYIDADLHANLAAKCQEVQRMLGAMIQHPEKFLLK